MTTLERLQAKIATLPTTRELVHNCPQCGEKAERWHDERLTERTVRQFTKCDNCGREVTLELVRA